MAKNTIGLEAVFIGEIPADGGVATTFEEVGQTARDTASLTSTEITTNDIFVEESDDPVISSNTGGGTFNITWTSLDVSTEKLVSALGGTVTGSGANTMWNAPDKSPIIYKSVRMVAPGGYEATAARVKLNVTVSFNFQRSNPAQITYNGVVMTPTKAGVPKLITGVPAVG